MATTYKAQADTAKWVETLKEGIQNILNMHSFGHLIDYYSNTNKYGEAMQFADDMLNKDPNNILFICYGIFIS